MEILGTRYWYRYGSNKNIQPITRPQTRYYSPLSLSTGSFEKTNSPRLGNLATFQLDTFFISALFWICWMVVRVKRAKIKMAKKNKNLDMNKIVCMFACVTIINVWWHRIRCKSFSSLRKTDICLMLWTTFWNWL